jgi:cyclophilin family peptidyl-prolyl cis-trans isomerase
MTHATLHTTHGAIQLGLFEEDAPKTVGNFVSLARDGFYDGITFHRLIPDFMIQGGCPRGDGTGGPGYEFEDEPNDRRVVRGALAMANRGPDTNGSQFFIVTAGRERDGRGRRDLRAPARRERPPARAGRDRERRAVGLIDRVTPPGSGLAFEHLGPCGRGCVIARPDPLRYELARGAPLGDDRANGKEGRSCGASPLVDQSQLE